MTDASGPPAITPDSLLPCDSDKFLCTDNMDLQTVLNVLFHNDPNADMFRISRNVYTAWLLKLAEWNPVSGVATTSPFAHFVLTHGALECNNWLEVARTFQRAAANSTRVVATMEAHVTDEPHMVAIAFDFTSAVMHIVDSNGPSAKVNYAEIVTANLPGFAKKLHRAGFAQPTPFSVQVPAAREFACAPQRGLINDAIVKTGSCMGWALLFVYALAHWSSCDLSNPHWYRCLAVRLTGVAQPSNVQYYAVLLRFLTQLISTARLEATGDGCVVDHTTGLDVEIAAQYDGSILRALQDPSSGSVSVAAFHEWFRALPSQAIKSVTSVPLLSARVSVHIPAACLGLLRDIACPLYMFTRACEQYAMLRVNAWQLVADGMHACVFAQLTEMAKVLPEAQVILTDDTKTVLGSCHCTVDDCVQLRVCVRTTNAVHAAALTAVLLAFMMSNWYIPIDAAKVTVAVPNAAKRAMQCLRVGAAKLRYVWNQRAKLWQLKVGDADISKEWYRRAPLVRPHILGPVLDQLVHVRERQCGPLNCPLFLFTQDGKVYAMSLANMWQELLDGVPAHAFWQLHRLAPLPDKTTMVLTDVEKRPLVSCSFSDGTPGMLVVFSKVHTVDGAAALSVVLLACVINIAIKKVPDTILHYPFPDALPSCLRVVATCQSYAAIDGAWILPDGVAPDAKRPRRGE